MALIIGGFGANTLFGTDQADIISGLGGNDKIYAGGGNDVLIGGTGADYLDGGSGFDTANYMLSTAAVTVSLLTGTGSGGHAQGDCLVSIEGLVGSIFGDRLTGDNNNNHLFGLSGNDTLDGGGGNDRLDGSLGSDRETGGAGNDTFIFRPFDGRDRVTDFSTAGDRLDLRTYNFAGLADVLSHASQSGADTLFDFGGGDQVTLLGVLKSTLDATDFIL